MRWKLHFQSQSAVLNDDDPNLTIKLTSAIGFSPQCQIWKLYQIYCLGSEFSSVLKALKCTTAFDIVILYKFTEIDSDHLRGSA